jgi:uncharacterized protein (TIGR02594 family)
MSIELPQMVLDIPRWYSIAASELGVHELAGTANAARVLEYHAATSLKATSDETSWCSSFACWAIGKAGLASTQSAAARSWLTWGSKLIEPKLGCVVVFSRDEAGPTNGHVAFYVRHTDAKTLHVLGGNQNNKVCGADYPLTRVLGYRWPVTP